MINEKPFFGLIYYELNLDTIEALQKSILDGDSITVLEYLNLSYRVINALETEGIDTVEDLLNSTRKEISQITNVGEKAVSDITDCLKRFDSLNEKRQKVDAPSIFRLKRKTDSNRKKPFGY